MLKNPKDRERYVLPCPLHPEREKKLGFFGDVIVGFAAGISLFVGLESLFGINVSQLNNPQMILKTLALGVISGYMGATILDSVAIMVSTRIMKSRKHFDMEKDKLRKLEERLKAATLSLQAIKLGDAYRGWNKYDEAEEMYEEALALDPKNIDALINKSFIHVERAEKIMDDDVKRIMHFESALKLLERAITIDDKSARAHYDRACYLHLAYGENKEEEVLSELQTAIELEPWLARLAQDDPDLEKLRAQKKSEIHVAD